MSEGVPYYGIINYYFFTPTTTNFKDLAYVYLNKWSHEYWIAPVNVSKKKKKNCTSKMIAWSVSCFIDD